MYSRGEAKTRWRGLVSPPKGLITFLKVFKSSIYYYVYSDTPLAVVFPS